ncbi:MAG TPA: polymer-forming cytoskeletal protein [Pyrinomonadaceae bacterium]|nr:polymer-forming cytoskeletal protein [Pyrinomonadaceae bacterium]
MVISRVQSISELALRPPCDPPSTHRFFKAGLIFIYWLIVVGVACAQSTPGASAGEVPVEIRGASDSTVFGVGHSIRITGNVKQGAMAFGGDVIVEGTVEGDVATIGGSVVQGPGARIGGDVIVLGGTYRHFDAKPNRNESSMTMMYAGYEQGLRDIMRNPSELLRPHWSSGYFGLRLLSVLFWFIVSLALTAAMPGTISRGMARLQLTTLRVAVIGTAGLVVTTVGVPVCLLILPAPLGTLVGLLALILILISFLFGRVIICGATGRWLQRKYIPLGRNSEAAALLIGTIFWVILLSLPYIWPLVIAILMVASLGLALTARYRVAWNRSQQPL